ncbi:ubiquitination network signaling protein [Akanthomyces lecanii RCEF 1005]|uniref:Ubiquitination network signaling protein n=1 Tax=Akanthomyces lecanii RCEF 1005 TaxID=1081108 RepID=A0A168JI76_CORDF|nr:ubiquitination network signaling protein [Akanthomyces lecanii RCEF 1005]
MPRASGSGKRQSGGGHRDSRQDNGSVTSGKRGSGRKSQSGNTAASASARPLDNGAAVSTASSLHNGHANGTAAAPTHVAAKCPVDASVATLVADDKAATDAARRASLGAESESSSDQFHNAATHVQAPNGNANGNANGSPVDSSLRQIDVNVLKNSEVHRDSGILDMASTVLRALPMQDTLAILIILMHIPTISLLGIYAIFACITFVPPVRTNSGMNLNLAEIFDGNSTTPSLVTVACMDIFFLLIWLFLWAPIQDAVLDLAKPVIAITLGGATRNDPSFRGIRTGFTWVFMYHIIRGTQSQWGHLVPDMPEAWRKVLSEDTPIGYYSKLYEQSSPYAWIRSIFAIHILTQSFLRYVREWYLRREKGDSNPPNPNELESAKNQPGQLVAPEAANDANTSLNPADTAISTPTLPPPTPTPQLSTAKKRRKQSAQVRLKQPLWAALASTKIVVVKEYQLSHAPSESAGANATDIHNLGNAPFDREPRQIWISYIGSDEICFNTSYFAHAEFDPVSSPAEPDPEAPPRPTGIDTTKPFYVKVNNAFWQPTRMHAVKEPDDEPSEASRWTGDIYGLRPASKYVCEFVDSRTDKVLFTASIRTVKEALRSKDGLSPMIAEGPQSLRPDSPVTTLKTSIEAAQVKLMEEKNRLKNSRKDCKIRINALKKENEATDNQLATAGNSDEKHRQKIRQQDILRTQAEREAEELADTVKRYDSSPELLERKKRVERTCSMEKKIFDAAQKEFNKHRSELESEVKAKEVERSNLNTRRNKIATRIAKVDNELVNLTDANSRGLNEAERRKQERNARMENITAIEQNYEERIRKARDENNVRVDAVINLQQQLETIQSTMSAGNGVMMDNLDSGMTPFPPPQSAPWNPSVGQAAFSGSLWPVTSGDLQPSLSGTALPPSTMGWQGPVTMAANENAAARMRSSSMLSDVSGFTGSSDGSPDASPFFPYNQPIGKAGHGHRGIGANRSNGSSGSGADGSPI